MDPSEIKHNLDVKGPDGPGVVWGRTEDNKVVVYLETAIKVGKRVSRVRDYAPAQLKPHSPEPKKKAAVQEKER